ncbi:unnamed protein product [Chrysodeixis includens]|uniref:FAM21/CAPZIP domain-containing protein n=1 Tax=Chrysodeixis includens TaxID=689277 RepID=A0A9P0FYG6_CHRIL|nr:unnamed protein product [Chrysodeixis includens]
MDDPGTEALRKLAPQWSLAGDEQLLTILQNTHQRLLSKCHETNTQLEQMATALNDASVRLQNVNNQFMALSSSQFIESRVYDDDDVVATEPAVKESPLPSARDELSSLKRGVWTLESAHEALAILHDSDTDTDSADEMPARLVLKPRDLYADRPLPYIIGSQPWKNKWHAGLVLEDSDSDSSTSKAGHDSEQYSHSEREDSPSRMHVADTHTTISEASSELPSEPGSLPQPSPADVATEIARRLGGNQPAKVDQEPVYEEPARPAVRKVYRPQDPVVSTVFPESPPPLSRPGSAASTASDIFADLHRPAYSRAQDTDLFHFNHQPDDEGDIFSDFAKPSSDQAKPTSLFDAGPTPNMFKSERQPEVTATQDRQTTDTQAEKGVKKPVGGISLFGKKDTESIGAAILKRNQRKQSTSDESGSDVKTESTSEQSKKEKDIFDDLFARSQPKKVEKDKINVIKDLQKEIVKKNDLKKGKDIPVAKEKVDLFSDNLFDDIDDIFTTNVVKMPENNTKSIFDDDDDLFSEIAAPKTVKLEASCSRKKRESIFDSEDELFSENISKSVEKPTIKENLKVKESNKSLFEDDIFGDEKTTNQLRETKINTVRETKKIKPEKEISTDIVTSFKSPSLFADDDDDDIFAKTKHTSDVKVVDDDEINISNKTEEINTNNNKNDFENNTKINNNSIAENKDKNLNSTIVDSNKKLPNSTERSPFKISGHLNKVIDASSSDDEEICEQDFDDELEQAKVIDHQVIKVENVNKQSIIDHDLDIDMFKERNKVEKSKENDKDLFKTIKDKAMAANEKLFKEAKGNITNETVTTGKPLAKDAVKVVKEYTAKVIKENEVKDTPKDTKEYEAMVTKDDAVENTTKDSKEYTATDVKDSLVKDTLKDIKEYPAKVIKDNVVNDTCSTDETVANDTLKDAKGTTENCIDENVKETIVKDTPKDIKESVVKDVLKDIKESVVKDTPKETIVKDTQEDDFTFNDILNNGKDKIIQESSETIEHLIFTKTEKENTKDIPKNVTANVFTEILSEPPVFEKPKEPKKSKNVNALFDDDSDDESLFFKKDDVISDEKPQDFKPAQDRLFGLFADEPPDDFKSDEDFFSKMPKPKIPQKFPSPAQVENFISAEPSNNYISDVLNRENELPSEKNLASNRDADILTTDDLFNAPKKTEKNENKKIDLDPNNYFPNKRFNLPFKDNTVDDMIKDTDDIFEERSKIIVKKELKADDFKMPISPISDQKPSKSDENPDLPEKSEPKKVGKLKLGLNINVNALLPGASPKKAKVNDQTDGQAQSQAQNLDKKEKDLDLPRAVSFDEVPKPDSEVLDNKLSKERPRIQVKRRPSTRRARKEAVRKSGIDFGDDSTDNSSSIDDVPKQPIIQPEIPKSENIDQTDGETSKPSYEIDIDKTPIQTETQAELLATTRQSEIQSETKQPEIQAETKKYENQSETKESEIQTQTKQDEITPTRTKVVYILNDEDIFDSPVEKVDPNPDKTSNLDSNTDLNPGVSTLGQVYDKAEKVETKSSLFDEDDDDEIFKGNVVKKQNIFDSDSDEELFGSKKEKTKVKPVKKDIKDVKVKGNLFGDDDDDGDDLFGVKTKSVVETPDIKPQPSRSSVKEPAKPSAPVFEDPLSMFGDDD